MKCKYNGVGYQFTSDNGQQATISHIQCIGLLNGESIITPFGRTKILDTSLCFYGLRQSINLIDLYKVAHRELKEKLAVHLFDNVLAQLERLEDFEQRISQLERRTT